MDQRLVQSQRHAQKMVLAPQLRQFLNLLQLPIFELQQRIEEEITQNPVLEEAPRTKDDETSDLLESDMIAEKNAEKDALQSLEAEIDYSGNDSLGKDYSIMNLKEAQRKRDFQEAILTKPRTLSDYLEWQLSILELSELDSTIAREIIGNINSDGRLVATVEEVAESTNSNVAQVQCILKKIQTLDPKGVGGRTLEETLLIQLTDNNSESKMAKKIVEDHFEFFKKKQLDQLARSLQTTADRIKKAYNLIAKLEPKPGRIFYQQAPNLVVPDARVSIDPEDENQLIIEFFDEEIPRLKINQQYRQLARNKREDKKTRKFLKEKIQAGTDLIRAIDQRTSTLQLITKELVRVQQPFFSTGFTHLKPLRLKDVAEKVGIHESTVSRAIQGKYLETPQGTIAYKKFFSTKLEGGEGASESQKSAMERVKLLVANENKAKPLSDSQIVTLLKNEGIVLARRTVAKYRDSLKILPAHLRKNR